MSRDDQPADTQATQETGSNGLGGPMNERLYWPTKKGWVAAILADHPSLGAPL